MVNVFFQVWSRNASSSSSHVRCNKDGDPQVWSCVACELFAEQFPRCLPQCTVMIRKSWRLCTLLKMKCWRIQRSMNLWSVNHICRTHLPLANFICSKWIGEAKGMQPWLVSEGKLLLRLPILLLHSLCKGFVKRLPTVMKMKCWRSNLQRFMNLWSVNHICRTHLPHANFICSKWIGEAKVMQVNRRSAWANVWFVARRGLWEWSVPAVGRTAVGVTFEIKLFQCSAVVSIFFLNCV